MYLLSLLSRLFSKIAVSAIFSYSASWQKHFCFPIYSNIQPKCSSLSKHCRPLRYTCRYRHLHQKKIRKPCTYTNSLECKAIEQPEKGKKSFASRHLPPLFPYTYLFFTVNLVGKNRGRAKHVSGPKRALDILNDPLIVICACVSFSAPPTSALPTDV